MRALSHNIFSSILTCVDSNPKLGSTKFTNKNRKSAFHLHSDAFSDSLLSLVRLCSSHTSHSIRYLNTNKLQDRTAFSIHSFISIKFNVILYVPVQIRMSLLTNVFWLLAHHQLWLSFTSQLKMIGRSRTHTHKVKQKQQIGQEKRWHCRMQYHCAIAQATVILTNE